MFDGDRLHDDLDEGADGRVDVSYLSQLCIEMLTERNNLGHVIKVLVSCCALNFGVVKFKDEDQEEEEDREESGEAVVSADNFRPEHHLRSPLPAAKIRRILDALKARQTFSCLSGDVNQNMFEDEFGTRMWKWIKKVYHNCITNEENSLGYRISLVQSSQCVMISGKLFDRQYVLDFYHGYQEQFRELWKDLDECFVMPGVEEIARIILRNRDISFREPKRGLNSSGENWSILDLLPVKFQRLLVPQIRGLTNEITEALNRKVAQTVDKIGHVLIWMVYFGVGFGYRFTELQQMAFGGLQRNVYIDDDSRRLQLFCDYNKNSSSATLLKTLDNLTSAYLFYILLS